MDRMEVIKQIIGIEWNAFDQVQNEGGRASCQDDGDTFFRMRASQYLCWSEELLMSYAMDLVTYEDAGRNIVAEKYAWMEKYTAPEAFEKIKHLLPEMSEEKEALIEEISAMQTAWNQSFAAQHKTMSEKGRALTSDEDTAWSTSSETYLKGELSTYSERTLEFYKKFVDSLAAEGKNLVEMIMENTAKLYGYSSVDEVR